MPNTVVLCDGMSDVTKYPTYFANHSCRLCVARACAPYEAYAIAITAGGDLRNLAFIASARFLCETARMGASIMAACGHRVLFGGALVLLLVLGRPHARVLVEATRAPRRKSTPRVEWEVFARDCPFL